MKKSSLDAAGIKHAIHSTQHATLSLTHRPPGGSAQSSTPNFNSDFDTESEYKEEGLLSSRLQTADNVRATEQHHVFIPVMKGIVNTKTGSASPSHTDSRVMSVLKDMNELKDITGFVTCMYDNLWWLRYVSSVSEELNDVKISFLHPHGPCASNVRPAAPHSLRLPQSAILAKVNRNTAKERQRQFKHTSVTSTNKVEMTSQFSYTLYKEYVVWPDASSHANVHKIVVTIFISFHTCQLSHKTAPY
jgi:hypothetical protein